MSCLNTTIWILMCFMAAMERERRRSWTGVREEKKKEKRTHFLYFFLKLHFKEMYLKWTFIINLFLYSNKFYLKLTEMICNS